jgi:hypothetical protein
MSLDEEWNKQEKSEEKAKDKKFEETAKWDKEEADDAKKIAAAKKES